MLSSSTFPSSLPIFLQLPLNNVFLYLFAVLICFPLLKLTYFLRDCFLCLSAPEVNMNLFCCSLIVICYKVELSKIKWDKRREWSICCRNEGMSIPKLWRTRQRALSASSCSYCCVRKSPNAAHTYPRVYVSGPIYL